VKKIKILILVISLAVAFFSPGEIKWQKLYLSGNTVCQAKENQKENAIKRVLPQKEMEEAFKALGVIIIKPPQSMIDFTLDNLKGEKISTKSLRGKFLWINFWATWCPPCRGEMPSMEKVWKKFGGDDFVILAVNLREDKKTVHSFVSKNGFTFPILLDKSGKVGISYGVRAIPSNLFVDPQGNIVGAAIGAREWDNDKFYNFLKTYFLKNKLHSAKS